MRVVHVDVLRAGRRALGELQVSLSLGVGNAVRAGGALLLWGQPPDRCRAILAALLTGRGLGRERVRNLGHVGADGEPAGDPVGRADR